MRRGHSGVVGPGWVGPRPPRCGPARAGAASESLERGEAAASARARPSSRPSRSIGSDVQEIHARGHLDVRGEAQPRRATAVVRGLKECGEVAPMTLPDLRAVRAPSSSVISGLCKESPPRGAPAHAKSLQSQRRAGARAHDRHARLAGGTSGAGREVHERDRRAVSRAAERGERARTVRRAGGRSSSRRRSRATFPGEFPRSKPSTRRLPTSPARSVDSRPSWSSPSASPSPSLATGITPRAPASSATAIVVLARRTPITTQKRSSSGKSASPRGRATPPGAADASS